KESILKRLNKVAADKVVQLLHFGPSTETSRAVEITEYMEHGSLDTLLRQAGYQLAVPMVRLILWEIADALAHVHAEEVEHRDLKPENILIRSQDPFDLVLTDFGISSVMQMSQRSTGRDRTIRYA